MKNKYRLFYQFLALALILSFLKWENIAYPAQSNQHGYIKTNNEYHYQVKNILLFLKNEIKNEDAIVSTLSNALILDLGENYNIVNYDYQDDDKELKLSNTVQKYHRGWILIDHQRNVVWDKCLPLKNFYINSTKVLYLKKIDDIYVYFWEK